MPPTKPHLGKLTLIISVHIPKTAGESFRARLRSTFQSRVLLDYGDWVGFDTPETVARRELRKNEMRARADELTRDYDIIHGHFKADKYVDLFPQTFFSAFFRDPYQQSISQYQYFLRHPEIDHPAIKMFHQRKLNPVEFIAALPNTQAEFLGQVNIDDFSMVGLMEQYDRSIALFEAVFSQKLAAGFSRENVNPARTDGEYSIDREVRLAVDTHRGGDIKLHQRAAKRFEALCKIHGI